MATTSPKGSSSIGDLMHVKSGPIPMTDNTRTLYTVPFCTDNIHLKSVCGLSVIGVGPDLPWIIDKR